MKNLNQGPGSAKNKKTDPVPTNSTIEEAQAYVQKKKNTAEPSFGIPPEKEMCPPQLG